MLNQTRRPRGVASLILLAGLAGCDQPQISVYQAPKDRPAHSHSHDPAETQAAAERPRPKISWTLPAGWKETTPGAVSLASFIVSGPAGKEAQASVTLLPALGDREMEVVNMWRGQLKLAPVTRAEAQELLQDVQVAGQPGKMFELSGTLPDATEPVAILTAMMHQSEGSWFIRLSGEGEVVASQRQAFVEFIRSLRIEESQPAATAETASSSFKWQVPAQWQELPAGQMQVARFSAQEGLAKAEVSVSIFPHATGSTLDNVNRWRGMVGLGPITEAELKQNVTALDPAQPDAILVDVNNDDKRLLAASVPRQGRYYFYKMLGDQAVVAAQKEAFLQFVNSEP